MKKILFLAWAVLVGMALSCSAWSPWGPDATQVNVTNGYGSSGDTNLQIILDNMKADFITSNSVDALIAASKAIFTNDLNTKMAIVSNDIAATKAIFTNNIITLSNQLFAGYSYAIAQSNAAYKATFTNENHTYGTGTTQTFDSVIVSNLTDINKTTPFALYVENECPTTNISYPLPYQLTGTVSCAIGATNCWSGNSVTNLRVGMYEITLRSGISASWGENTYRVGHSLSILKNGVVVDTTGNIYTKYGDNNAAGVTNSAMATFTSIIEVSATTDILTFTDTVRTSGLTFGTHAITLDRWSLVLKWLGAP